MTMIQQKFAKGEKKFDSPGLCYLCVLLFKTL